MAKTKKQIIKELANLQEEAGQDFDNLLAQAKQQKETLVIVFPNESILPPYEGWKLESDNSKQPTGEIKFKLAPILKDGETSISGNEMVNRAEAMDADWCQKVGEKILTNQDKIPEFWRSYHLPTPGTIWLDSVGDRVVAFLYWDGERWVLDFFWLDFDWDEFDRFLLPCE